MHFDNARAFNNDEVKAYVAEIGAKARYITPHNHKGQGCVERTNHLLRKLLNVFEKGTHRTFVDVFRDAVFALNHTPRGIFGEKGLTPYEVMFNRPSLLIPDLPDGDIRKDMYDYASKEIEEAMKEGQEKLIQLDKQNKALLEDNSGIQVGTLVLLRRYLDVRAHRDKQKSAYFDDVIFRVIERRGHRIRIMDIKDPDHVRTTTLDFVKPIKDREDEIYNALKPEQMHNLGNPRDSEGNFTVPGAGFRPKPISNLADTDSASSDTEDEHGTVVSDVESEGYQFKVATKTDNAGKKSIKFTMDSKRKSSKKSKKIAIREDTISDFLSQDGDLGAKEHSEGVKDAQRDDNDAPIIDDVHLMSDAFSQMALDRDDLDALIEYSTIIDSNPSQFKNLDRSIQDDDN